MGTMEMFYGYASQSSAAIADKVSVNIVLAPITRVSAVPDIGATFNLAQFYDRLLKDAEKTNLFAVFGPNWEKDKEALCKADQLLCAAIKAAEG